eukprot:scaffold1788_cov396-Prasinococcus_capsulatus_cf.AAC.11
MAMAGSLDTKWNFACPFGEGPRRQSLIGVDVIGSLGMIPTEKIPHWQGVHKALRFMPMESQYSIWQERVGPGRCVRGDRLHFHDAARRAELILAHPWGHWIIQPMHRGPRSVVPSLRSLHKATKHLPGVHTGETVSHEKQAEYPILENTRTRSRLCCRRSVIGSKTLGWA